jgi:Ca2+-binding EF-hand superfamily protein
MSSSDAIPVSLLLDRPGSVEPPELAADDPPNVHQETYLDLPVDLPMLAPEIPVLSVQRAQSLYGFPELVTEEKKESCHLENIDVLTAVSELGNFALLSHEGEKYHTIDSFSKAVGGMCHGQSCPSPENISRLFESMSPDDKGKVALRSSQSAIVLLTKGSMEAKIGSIFAIADLDGDGSLSFEELFEFFRLVLSNVLTRTALGHLNANGVPLNSPEQLAATTAKECMEMCDLDRNGCLSLTEFTNWFRRPNRKTATVYRAVST